MFASVLLLRPPRDAPDAELGARLERTEARLRGVQRQLDDVGRRPALTREIVTQVAAPAASAPRDPTAVEAAPREDVDPVALAGELLETEPSDPSWSRPAERELQDAFRAPAIDGSRVGDVRCGSTLCRLTFTHDDDEAVERFRENVALLNPFPESSVLVRHESGPTGDRSSVVFVARSGRGLVAQL